MPPAKGYTEMKDSGIEWLGKIPNNWRTIRVKYAFRIKKEIAGELGHTVLSVTQRGIKPKDMSEKGQFSLDYSKYQLVSSGDFIMNHMDLLTGWVDISNMDGVTSPDYRVFQSSNPEKYYPDFYRYVFQTCYQQRIFYGLGQGVSGFGRWRLPAEIFLNFYLPVPPYESQSAIAAYLDTQCAKIDEIIAQAKASIEDYKQWKASIIYEAVTKGLDPNVEMKESGIPCVDEIPKSWTVTRFGKIATVKSNLVNPKDYQSYKQISPENIEKGSGVLLDCGTVEESGVISGNHLFYKGQILYSKIRPTLNKVIIAPFDGLCSADMYPIDTDHCSRFILYLMLSAYFNEQVALVTGNRVKMPKINQNELSQIMVAIPSGTEEQQIAKYLDSSCSQIDVLIKEKQSLLDDLESYKKSLIYEIVTGKRSVQQ